MIKELITLQKEMPFRLYIIEPITNQVLPDSTKSNEQVHSDSFIPRIPCDETMSDGALNEGTITKKMEDERKIIESENSPGDLSVQKQSITMAKFTNKIAVHFEVPVENLADNKQVKAAYTTLAQQIMDYAKALEKDPNILIVDAVFITNPQDYVKRADTPINVHIAEMIAKRTEALTKPVKKPAEDAKPVPDKPAAPKVTPKVAPKVIAPKPPVATPAPAPVLPPTEPGEKPCVKAMDMTAWHALKAKAEQQVEAETKAAVAPAAPAPTPAPEPTPEPTQAPEEAPAESKIKVTKPVVVADDDVKFITDKIFETLKRTEKSVTILTAMAKAGGEVNLDDLVAATKLTKNDLSSWLNQTGKKVPAIETTGRGKYKLNPDKV